MDQPAVSEQMASPRARPSLTRRAIPRILAALPVPFILSACRGPGAGPAQRAPAEPPGPSAGSSPASSPDAADPVPTPRPDPAPTAAGAKSAPEEPDQIKGNFYTRVIMNDPRFESTEIIGDLDLLEPVTRQKVQST